MAENRKLRVFLSYAHADVEPVRKLHEELIEQGYDVWFDEESLVPGQDWRVEIEKNLYSSDAVIVCLSAESVSKEGFVQKEFKFALDKTLEMPEGRVFLIPVLLEECEVPTRLSQFHWVNLYQEKGLERLLKGLNLRREQLNLQDSRKADYVSTHNISSKKNKTLKSIRYDDKSMDKQRVSTSQFYGRITEDKFIDIKRRLKQAGIIGIVSIILALATGAVVSAFIIAGGGSDTVLASLIIGVIWFVAFSFYPKHVNLIGFTSRIFGTYLIVLIFLSILVNYDDRFGWSLIVLSWVLILFPISWALRFWITKK